MSCDIKKEEINRRILNNVRKKRRKEEQNEKGGEKRRHENPVFAHIRQKFGYFIFLFALECVQHLITDLLVVVSISISTGSSVVDV